MTELLNLGSPDVCAKYDDEGHTFVRKTSCSDKLDTQSACRHGSDDVATSSTFERTTLHKYHKTLGIARRLQTADPLERLMNPVGVLAGCVALVATAL